MCILSCLLPNEYCEMCIVHSAIQLQFAITLHYAPNVHQFAVKWTNLQDSCEQPNVHGQFTQHNGHSAMGILHSAMCLSEYGECSAICKGNICPGDVCPGTICQAYICKSDIFHAGICPGYICQEWLSQIVVYNISLIIMVYMTWFFKWSARLSSKIAKFSRENWPTK